MCISESQRKIFWFQFRDNNSSFDFSYGNQHDRKFPLSLSLSEGIVVSSLGSSNFLFWALFTLKNENKKRAFSSQLFPDCRGKPNRERYLGQRFRILNVLHRHVHRSWQCLAISIHGLREWWRSISNTLHHRPLSCW